MAITSGLFNSINGDRRYDAKWFAQYFATFIGNGVFPNPSTGLQVAEGVNMTTVVKSGKGWIDGYFIVNDSDYVLQHDVADGVLKRIDRVVMRLNYLTRQIEIIVLKGAYASTPVAPVITRNTDYYDLVLANVTIVNGAIRITQAQITDTRLNSNLCGIVHGTVNQVDTTTLFNQYQSWFTNQTTNAEQTMSDWQRVQYGEFLNWFESIKEILDGDVVGNLLNAINSVENSLTQHSLKMANTDELGHIKTDGISATTDDGVLKVHDFYKEIIEVVTTTITNNVEITNLGYTEIDIEIRPISRSSDPLTLTLNGITSYREVSLRYGTSFAGTATVSTSLGLGSGSSGICLATLNLIKGVGVVLNPITKNAVGDYVYRSWLNDTNINSINKINVKFTDGQPIGTKIILKCR